jgi:hypothetical protein
MRAATLCLLLLLGALAWPAGGFAQEQEDLTEVERFTDGDPDAGAKLYKPIAAAATAPTVAAAPTPSCRMSRI